MKREIIALTVFIFSGMGKLYSQLSSAPPFMTRFTPKSAVVTDYAYKDTIPSYCGLIRLPN